jgi:hypothetical protein
VQTSVESALLDPDKLKAWGERREGRRGRERGERRKDDDEGKRG